MWEDVQEEMMLHGHWLMWAIRFIDMNIIMIYVHKYMYKNTYTHTDTLRWMHLCLLFTNRPAQRWRGGNWGSLPRASNSRGDLDPKRKRGPWHKLKRGSLSVVQRTDKSISFMFQMQIKKRNKIRYFCSIDPICLFIERWTLIHWIRAGRSCLYSISYLQARQ